MPFDPHDREYLEEHFDRHGHDFGAETPEEYEAMADAFVGRQPVAPPVYECCISIFHEVSIGIGTSELPSDAILPREWAIFSKWELTPQECGINYSSRTKIYWPNGSVFAEQKLDAIQPTRDGMAFIMRINGFPVGQNGRLTIVNTLESNGEVVSEWSEFTIGVKVEKGVTDLATSESL